MSRLRLQVATWRRFLRVAVAGALAFGVWYIVDRSAPAWLATVVAFVLLALMAGLIEREAPSLARRVSGGAPIGAIAVHDDKIYSDGWRLAFPGELLASNHPEHAVPLVEARRHLVGLGGYDVQRSHLRLTIEGRNHRSIVVTEVRARVLSREPPLIGTLVTAPAAGISEVPRLHFNLDRDDNVARTEKGVRFFRDNVLSLADGEVVLFSLIGQVTNSACTWEIEIEFDVSGEYRTVAVAARGGPFRTTARSDHYARRLHWAWYEPPASLIAEPDLGL